MNKLITNPYYSQHYNDWYRKHIISINDIADAVIYQADARAHNNILYMSCNVRNQWYILRGDEEVEKFYDWLRLKNIGDPTSNSYGAHMWPIAAVGGFDLIDYHELLELFRKDHPVGDHSADTNKAEYESCGHEWNTYLGLTETYEYCKHCDAKREKV